MTTTIASRTVRQVSGDLAAEFEYFETGGHADRTIDIGKCAPNLCQQWRR